MNYHTAKRRKQYIAGIKGRSLIFLDRTRSFKYASSVKLGQMGLGPDTPDRSNDTQKVGSFVFV